MNNKKFLVIAKRWFDEINGNTYHSVKITDLETGKVYIVGKTYGYGSHYEYTAMKICLMLLTILRLHTIILALIQVMAQITDFGQVKIYKMGLGSTQAR